MKKWQILGTGDDILQTLLANRGLTEKKDIERFLHPQDPADLTPHDVGIDREALDAAIRRIQKAIGKKESIVVYADYDADGITAGTIMWETLHSLGAQVMPYIPHRVEEGYGLSQRGIDAVKEKYNPTLIITVDHGITAHEKVAYAREQGIEIIVTDHHVKPPVLPECITVHTTQLCGAGVSWFVAKELLGEGRDRELVALAAIGTIADMVPLLGANRSIAKWGLEALNRTFRPGLVALYSDAGLVKGAIGTYEISHMIAPRLNAAGRIEHALEALRLLCTRQGDKAMLLARKLGLTNKDRQQMTTDAAAHAVASVGTPQKKLLFLADEHYNQGVIGLVAGKLVEQYYRPSIVVAKGETISKASARSVSGFNIVEAIRSCSDILIDVGGHPMAAGFTVETKNLEGLKKRLEDIADAQLDEESLTRVLRIDMEVPLAAVTEDLWQKLRAFEPYGFGSPQPAFVTRNVTIEEVRVVGAEGKHLKLRLEGGMEAIGFGLGSFSGQLRKGAHADIAYSMDMNVWNGRKELQLKIKDIHFP